MNNYTLQLRKLIISIFLVCVYAPLSAQTVTIDYNTQRFLGNTSELDRQKYFTIHSNAGGDTDISNFLNTYNVSFGRGFWGPFSYAKGQTGSVGSYPAYKNGTTGLRNVSRFVSTEHPKNVVRWNIDKTVAANWAVEYWKDFVDDAGRPEFFEPMNEPFVHAGDAEFSAQQPDNALMRERMAEWFGEIGKKIHAEPDLDNMKVIGYSSAWPSMELWDFGHWDSRMKMFMDVAGQHMDAFAIHLYDGVNVTGQNNLRSGSNSEAILDLVEAYSYIKWGVVKDHAITEYGGIENGYGDNYSDLRSVQSIKSMNHIIFNLLERENNMAISIPFITDKSTWHINAANNYQPYGAALWKPTNLGQANPAGYEYTPRIYFYELWKDVKGKRASITTDNPDVQAQAFVSNNKLYVALNNLDASSQTVTLNMLDGVSGLQDVRTKSLKIYDNQNPVYSNTVSGSAPSSITLIAGETAVLEYTFASNITFDNAIRSEKYYTSKYLQTITANTEMSFAFNGVTTGTAGIAVLRMTIGRKHNVTKQPTVKVNGTTVAVPNNWGGYDQANREDFFGTIEIPVPMNLIQSNNTVKITFPDNGGRVAAVVLNVEKYDTPPATANESLSFSNPPSTLSSATSYAINVDYTASQSRDVVVEFWSSTGWLAEGKTTVTAGTGTAIVNVSLPTAPAAGSGYVLKGSIRPVGANWQSNIDTDQVNNITVTNLPTADTFTFSNPPTSLASKTAYPVSVDYTATQSRDVVVELWSSTGWLAAGTTTVAGGQGTAVVNINLSSAPATGTGYILKGSIRPVGTGWQSNIDTEQVNSITMTANQEAYSGTSHSIPGTIEAEDFDTGGAGVAYSDATTANQGGAYRTTEQVDIEACSEGGYNVGWVSTGEWLEYTVNVPSAGTYGIDIRYASQSATGQVYIASDGNNKTGTVTLPSTGGWQSFATVSATATLPAGEQVIRVYVQAGNINLNKFTFTSGGARTGITAPVFELNNDVFDVFPNPSNVGYFNIEQRGFGEEVMMQIYNLQGKMVKQSILKDFENRIDLQGLRSGNYIIKLTGELKSEYKKVIIQ